MNNKEYLYRYDYLYFNTELGANVKVHLHKYEIHHRTPKGAQIIVQAKTYFEDEKLRFVLLENTRKQYASETKERALEAFIRRKEIQISHLEYLLNIVKTSLELARKGNVESYDKMFQFETSGVDEFHLLINGE